MALDIYARYAQRSDPDDQGIAQIAITYGGGGFITRSRAQKVFVKYNEASEIVRRNFPNSQKYLNLDMGLDCLTIGTGIISNDEYKGIVQELLKIKSFRTEPQFNEHLDRLISRVTLLGEPSRIIS